MCVYMQSRFIENHPIQILNDKSFISDEVLSQNPHNFLTIAPIEVILILTRS
jgi:hypothetical protein